MFVKEAMMTVIYLTETDGRPSTRIERRRRLRDAEQIASASGVDFDQVDRVYEVIGDEATLIYERPELAAVTAAERAYHEAAERERALQAAISLVFRELHAQVAVIEEALVRREGNLITPEESQILGAFERSDAAADELWRETAALSKKVGRLLMLGHNLDAAERRRQEASAGMSASMRAAGWQEV